MNALLLCSVVGAAAWPAPDEQRPTPADAAFVSLADAFKLDGETARHTRYFYAGHVPAAERGELYGVFSYHVNGLSREATVVRPRRVRGWLWAVDARDYGWSLEVFGALAYEPGTVEPYFHVEPVDPKTGKAMRPLIPAPWLPAAHAELMTLTRSSIPLVRADWFLFRTAIQEGRKGHGYYDFLALRSRADAEKLAGLDREKAQAIYREAAAVIPTSGVALQGRQMFRFSTIAGAWWETRDSKGDKDGRAQRNAERNLLEDYKHDAEEIVFTLPNRLPAFYLSDAKGVQADSAPPDIASDGKSASNDRRVHVGLSCIRCHESGGLKGFSDHFRRLYGAGSGLSLGGTNDAQFRRLKSVYLGPIERGFKADAEGFGEAVTEASGLTPAGLSAAYARQWSRYVDEGVSLDRLAEEAGVERDAILDGIRSRGPLVDLTLAGYLAKPPVAARREQVEEAWPLLMTLVEAKGP